MIGTIIILFLCSVLYLFFTHKKDPRMPPGLYGWPIIGSLPSFKMQLIEQVENYRKKYGDIFLWRVGMRNIIYISDPKVIKKAFSNPLLLDRPDPFYSFDSWSNFGKTGLVNTNGLHWLLHRRFALRHLRDAGFGKSTAEEIIRMEAEYLTTDLQENYLDIPTEVPFSVNVATLNVIWKLEADIRFERNDNDLQNFLGNLNKLTELVQGMITLYDLFPFLIKITPNFIANNILFYELQRSRQNIKTYIKKVVDDRKRHFNRENPCGLIDAYFLEIENGEAKDIFSEDSLKILLGDLFFAGSDTTATTIKWGLQYMARFPEIQEKIHNEIDSNISKDTIPSLSDKASMPYTEATLHELLRITTLAPFGLFHAAAEDTTLEQYFIPKGTIITSFLYGCHMDPKYWSKPNEFYPEHFLDAEGNFSAKNEAFMPFSTGRRSCLGEALTRTELFLFFTALMQKFSFRLAEENKEAEVERDPSSIIFSIPPKLKIVIKERST